MPADFDVIAEGLAFPEGPVVMPDGSVILVELTAGRITRVWNGRKEVVCEIGGGPNGAQLGPDGALYVCNNGGASPADPHIANPAEPGRIERVDLATGRFERVLEQIDGRPLSAPNDLVIDADGGIWFTDMGKWHRHQMDRSAIGYCRTDGGEACTVHYGGLGYNGIGLSPEGTRLYVASTFSARVYEMPILGPGRIAPFEGGPHSSPGRLVGGVVGGDAHLDSLAVTASGNICAATLWTGGITTITPGGNSRFLKLPDHFVTNIAFGGDDMRDAYITCVGTGRLLKMRWPEPGLRLHFN